MTFDEFDRMVLAVRWEENEPSRGFRRVLISPETSAAIRAQWSWAGNPPRPFEVSTRVTSSQIGIER